MRPKRDFNVGLRNGLLAPKHYLSMRGDALWLYMFLLDRQTRGIDKHGLGKVAGGAPISDGDVAGAFGCSEKTVSRWRRKLQRGGYITTRRTSFGYVYSISKPKKWPGGDRTETAYHGSCANGGVIGQNRPADRTDMASDRTEVSETKKRIKRYQVEAVSPATTSAVSETQMEGEFLKVWDHYLKTFDKEETAHLPAKKIGIATLRELHRLGQPDPATQMECAIDVAHHLVKTQPKKAFFADWFKIFGKWNTFVSLRHQWTEDIPCANLSETIEGEKHD